MTSVSQCGYGMSSPPGKRSPLRVTVPWLDFFFLFFFAVIMLWSMKKPRGYQEARQPCLYCPYPPVCLSQLWALKMGVISEHLVFAESD